LSSSRFRKYFSKLLRRAHTGKGRDKRRRKAKPKDHAAPLHPRIAPPDLAEPDALVYASLKPRPRRGSGAIALPQPSEQDHIDDVTAVRY
jgi:hypothetical protein